MFILVKIDPNSQPATESRSQIDLPLEYTTPLELDSELRQHLPQLRDLQAIVDSQYTDSDILQIIKEAKHGNQVFTAYSGTAGRVLIIWEVHGDIYEWSYLHIIDINMVKVISLICGAIDVETKIVQDIIRNTQKNNEIVPVISLFMFIPPKQRILYHTHSAFKTGYVCDSSNFVVPLSGRTIIKTCTPPDLGTVTSDVRELKSLTCINNQKPHLGMSDVDDTFLFYLDVRIDFRMLAEKYYSKK